MLLPAQIWLHAVVLHGKGADSKASILVCVGHCVAGSRCPRECSGWKDVGCSPCVLVSPPWEGGWSTTWSGLKLNKSLICREICCPLPFSWLCFSIVSSESELEARWGTSPCPNIYTCLVVAAANSRLSQEPFIIHLLLFKLLSEKYYEGYSV